MAENNKSSLQGSKPYGSNTNTNPEIPGFRSFEDIRKNNTSSLLGSKPYGSNTNPKIPGPKIPGFKSFDNNNSFRPYYDDKKIEIALPGLKSFEAIVKIYIGPDNKPIQNTTNIDPYHLLKNYKIIPADELEKLSYLMALHWIDRPTFIQNYKHTDKSKINKQKQDLIASIEKDSQTKMTIHFKPGLFGKTPKSIIIQKEDPAPFQSAVFLMEDVDGQNKRIIADDIYNMKYYIAEKYHERILKHRSDPDTYSFGNVPQADYSRYHNTDYDKQQQLEKRLKQQSEQEELNKTTLHQTQPGGTNLAETKFGGSRIKVKSSRKKVKSRKSKK